ncbi:hypothetical protein E2C01_102248 [Portunus trituberculatus]|uniref:Uncharacterized protein n=1 Tax=Portunus trituberculatus TaxID=210409 RepID=A0A5B7KHV7_PORTR|nr:hypothetical protein [Portunus trituberculatus]
MTQNTSRFRTCVAWPEVLIASSPGHLRLKGTVMVIHDLSPRLYNRLTPQDTCDLRRSSLHHLPCHKVRRGPRHFKGKKDR